MTPSTADLSRSYAQADDADSTRLCLMGRRPHRALPGTYACHHHHEKLAGDLADIELEFALLDPVKSAEIRLDGGGGGLASHQTPARVDVLTATDRRRNAGRLTADDHDPLGLDDSPEVFDVLHSWALQVRELRALATVDQPTISGEHAVLSRNVLWIEEQDWLDEFARDISELAQSLRRLNGVARASVSVGICPTLIGPNECGGKLWLSEADGSVRCGRCHRRFDQSELRHLGDMLIKQGYVDLFRAEWFTGVPASTLRRWISERRLSTQRDGRRSLVRIAEVEEVRARLKQRKPATD